MSKGCATQGCDKYIIDGAVFCAEHRPLTQWGPDPMLTPCRARHPTLAHVICGEMLERHPKDHQGVDEAANPYHWPILPPAVPAQDNVNHPPHYNQGRIEVITFIEDKKLDFHLGNVVKYVCRAQHKGQYLEDLKKARWYLERAIGNAAQGIGFGVITNVVGSQEDD